MKAQDFIDSLTVILDENEDASIDIKIVLTDDDKVYDEVVDIEFDGVNTVEVTVS